jgi:dTDP-glucose pyrophosphorylase
MVNNAVILAAGSASRMQENLLKYVSDDGERAAIRKGEKMAARFRKFPFLDYQIVSLIQAGLSRINIVLKPDDVYFTGHYTKYGKTLFPEVEISFSYQEVTDGTAHAVLAAGKFVGDERCIVINGDNNYSAESVGMLLFTPPEYSSLAAFDTEGFNKWTRRRVRGFAVVITEDGKLKNIVEKSPNPQDHVSRDRLYTKGNGRVEVNGRVLISMNLWCFCPDIIEACRKIERHGPRKTGKPGEYELTDAVHYMMRRNNEFLVYYANDDVLDLTRAEDIEIVGKRIQENLKDKIEELEKRYGRLG